jgi:hypothetical protein
LSGGRAPPYLFMDMRRPSAAVLAIALVVLAGPLRPVHACPFCSVVWPPFSKQIDEADVATVARLVKSPTAEALVPKVGEPVPLGEFQIVDVLKGFDQVVAAGLAGVDAKPLEATLLEERPVGTLYLCLATAEPAEDAKSLAWASPSRISDRAAAHIKRLSRLPKEGPDRLAFFQQYLEDEDELLAKDAYNEFAGAPYADVRGLRDRMDPAKLLDWIENPKTQISNRRLYATMLGVCGTRADADRIAAILEGKTADGEPLPADRVAIRGGLDAMIACLVALRGAEALDLIDRLFLERTGRDVPVADTYAAVMALRFLGEESDLVPRERVLASLRLLLDEPKLADLVIADLARWQDWSAIDKLVAMFKTASRDTIFIREPIVNYLRACPLPEAAAAMQQLERIDPEACRRASQLAGLGGRMVRSPDGEGAESPVEPGADRPPSSETPTTIPPGETRFGGPIGGVVGPGASSDEPIMAPEEASGASATPPDAGSVRGPWGISWIVAAAAAALAGIVLGGLRRRCRTPPRDHARRHDVVEKDVVEGDVVEGDGAGGDSSDSDGIAPRR